MRWWLAIPCLVAGAVLLETDAAADGPTGILQLGAGYAAKEGCSCAFVEGQTDAICTNYAVAPTTLPVTLQIDHSANTVTATTLGLSRIASFTKGAGCVLQGL